MSEAEPGGAPAYELCGVVKRYGSRTVLHAAHLAIPAGRTLAILGPSGAGKSTLLRLLGFLEAPDEGSLRFGGVATERAPLPIARRRQVTMVFQRPILLNTSVWNNVAYGLWLRGRVARERVAEALERVGMGHLAKARALTLSGGEAQRVALARALVLQPEVLLLDEPTANLDPANVRIIEEVLQTLRAGPTTIVIVTHNLFQARRLADDVLLLIEGEVIAAGPAPYLFEQANDPRVVAFFQGTMVY